jgi:uncharacterized protein YeaO (DUF488 family)
VKKYYPKYEKATKHGGLTMSVQIKRIYHSKNRDNNKKRILVDRVWPRGIAKEDANLDEWLKDVAPSPKLRKWFHHDPEKFKLFKEKYKKELDNDEQKALALQKLKNYASQGELILLYGAKDEVHNHAIVLKELLT